MAKRYWQGGGDPLQERLRIGGKIIPGAADEPVRQIIGIVGNVHHRGLTDKAGPAMYFPEARVSDGLNKRIASTMSMAWIVRAAPDTPRFSAAVQQVMEEETGRPVTALRSMAQVWRLSVSRQRLDMWLMRG